MADVKVLAGDIKIGTWGFYGTRMEYGRLVDDIDFIKDVVSVEKLDEHSAKSFFGAAGWGAAGLVIAGPLGLVGGALFGGKKNIVAFKCTMKDGRLFMAQTSASGWSKIQAARFDAERINDIPMPEPPPKELISEEHIKNDDKARQQDELRKLRIIDDEYSTVGELMDYAEKYGYSRPKYLLGTLFYEGVVIPKNDESAKYWLTRAVEEDYEPACKALNEWW